MVWLLNEFVELTKAIPSSMVMRIVNDRLIVGIYGRFQKLKLNEFMTYLRGNEKHKISDVHFRWV